MKKRIYFAGLATVFILTFLFSCVRTKAAPTDEIIKYDIVVDVNEDATLTMQYHLEWKVLDDSIGAVDWVDIGIPNDHNISCRSLGDNIKNLYTTSNGPGDYILRIYFTRQYYEDEIIPIDFEIVQDYMYEMNVLTEGETVYYFTPGWFNEIAVDDLTISWNAENASSWSHGASTEEGRLIWHGSLSAGQKFDEISVTYPTTSYNFNDSKTTSSVPDDYMNTLSDYRDILNHFSPYDSNSGYSGYSSLNSDDFGPYTGGWSVNQQDDYNPNFLVIVIGIIAKLWVPIIFYILVRVVLRKVMGSYKDGSGLSSKPATKKKITRTLIKYYPECPGCAAPRPENAEKCAYCGRSFIESEEVVEEKEIVNPELYSSEGTFRYGSSPNTYVRVHVTHIPIPTPTRSSCVHSSCVHSSCACAHSCACACACACAGGGRAGCSTKDFYNTGLKLKQLSLRKKHDRRVR